jgi:hypothetical protein
MLLNTFLAGMLRAPINECLISLCFRTGYDLTLLKWLETYTFPREAAFKDDAYAKDAHSRVVSRTLSWYLCLFLTSAEPLPHATMLQPIPLPRSYWPTHVPD